MKRIDLKEIPLSLLCVIGILATAMSFVYYFVLKNPYPIILWTISLIDLLLFTVSAYRVAVNSFDLVRTKALIVTFTIMIFFLAFCEAVVLLFTVGSDVAFSFKLFTDTLRVALFLSPSLILLIPVIYLVAVILG